MHEMVLMGGAGGQEGPTWQDGGASGWLAKKTQDARDGGEELHYFIEYFHIL